jgi:hypothetical protein
MKLKILKLIFFGTIVSFAVGLNPVSTSAALDNANIVSDYNFSNSSNPMSAAAINDFLIAKGSKLANYVIPEYIDVPYPLAAGGFGTVTSRQVNDINGNPFYGKTVAQMIYDEGVEHNINPRVILATLQKESSAITGDVFRSSTVATWPMFYMYDETMAGCLNSGLNCDDASYRQRSLDYGGMGRQLGYSIGWFGSRYSSYKNGGRLINGSYQQYYDAVTIDGQSIACQTAGSRILYLYTPHIQTSFYNIFTSFFGDPSAGEPPPPPPAVNDTTPVNGRTYNGAITYSGAKTLTAKAYYGDRLLADLNTTSWSVTIEPGVGTTNTAIVFKNEAGEVVTEKPIVIVRHKIADINNDGAIDITDLAIFAENWSKESPPEAMADIDGNNVVDITDLAIFAENWGK